MSRTILFLIGVGVGPMGVGAGVAQQPNPGSRGLRLGSPSAVEPTAPVRQESEDRLDLLEAVELGLARHPAVSAARAEESAARAGVGQARSRWFPRLAVGASLTENSDPMIVFPIHAFELDAVPPFSTTLVRATGSLSYTLFDGFGRGATVRRARAELGVAEAEVTGATQVLVAEVATAYLNVLSSRAVLDAHERRIAALEAELGRVNQLLEVGRAARLESLRVEAELESARADRVTAAVELDVSERNLARLVGAPPQRTRAGRLTRVSLPPEVPTPALDELVARAGSGNPAVVRAERRRDAAESAVSLAQSDWWPTLGLTGNLIDYDSPDAESRLEWNVGVALRWSLFTGLERSRGVERAEARTRAAEESLRLARLEVAQAVDRAYSVVRQASARVESLEAATARFEEVSRIERLRLQTGAGVQTDFLRAEAELLLARAGLAETRHFEMIARVELARVLGELTPSWLAHNLEIEP